MQQISISNIENYLIIRRYYLLYLKLQQKYCIFGSKLQNLSLMKKSKQQKFATVINCMDGRTQLPVSKWVIKNYQIDYPDAITEAGPVKIIAENTDKKTIESIKYRVAISVNKHKSKHLFLVAHYDCAGNPEAKSKQLKQLKKAVKNIRKWDYKVNEITGLWVGKNWKVKAYYTIKNT